MVTLLLLGLFTYDSIKAKKVEIEDLKILAAVFAIEFVDMCIFYMLIK